MDTVEELNGTYFYAGKSNLSAAELLFMIFCENTASQFGIGVADFGAVVALVAGRNNLGTRGNLPIRQKEPLTLQRLHELFLRRINSPLVSHFRPG